MISNKTEKNHRFWGIILTIVFLFSLLLVVLYVVLLINSFVFWKYRGKYPELYSVAIHTVLSNAGNSGETNSTIEIIEEDKFGRILFSYTEHRNLFSYIIIQKNDGVYSYFIEDYNYISNKYNNNYLNGFTLDQIDELKVNNHWSQELDESNFKSVEIVRRRAKIKTKLNEKVYNEIFLQIATSEGYLGDDNLFRYTNVLTTDKYGRILLYVNGINPNKEGLNVDGYPFRYELAMIVNPDGTYDETTFFFHVKDIYNTRQEIINLKLSNNWNNPFTT